MSRLVDQTNRYMWGHVRVRLNNSTYKLLYYTHTYNVIIICTIIIHKVRQFVCIYTYIEHVFSPWLRSRNGVNNSFHRRLSVQSSPLIMHYGCRFSFFFPAPTSYNNITSCPVIVMIITITLYMIHD